MKAKTVTEVLIAARWILDNVGWCQKMTNLYQSDKHSAFDIIAALGEVETNSNALFYNAYNRLKLSLSNPCINLIVFNDDPTTTKEMVLALFDRAIAKE